MAGEPHTIVELARAVRAGQTTAVAVTTGCLERISSSNASINAFITVCADAALEQAAAADAAIAAGRDLGLLHGVPISVKDLFDQRGTPTTAASAVRRGHIAQADAPTVARLRAAGAVLIGKTNLHEFALGTTNEDSAYGPVRHPLDPTRSPGGSSGGSAASILGGMAFASLGSDTGGSIRIPAAACGLVGLKPAVGEIPTAGSVPLSSTLDHAGPICRSVVDAALLYSVLRGDDPPAEPPVAAAVAPRRLGVLVGYFTERLDDGVRRAFDEARRRLRAAGVTLDEVELPRASLVPSIYLHIVLSEAAAYHAQTLEQHPDRYTENVRLRLEMGRYILAEDYLRALAGRRALAGDVEAALADRDALLLPALAVPATPLGAETIRVDGVDEPVRAITLRLTQPFNLTGHPAITVPCGETPGGLPVGAQLVGRRTPALLDVARALEPILTAA